MQPISPVISKDYQKLETVFAKDQPEYIPLPTLHFDGIAISRWKLTLWERIRVLFLGDVYLSQMTFGRPLQPVKLDTKILLAINTGTEETF